MGAAPPLISNQPAEGRFVDLESFSGLFQYDIRYARADNFIGRPVYPLAKAYLQREAAEDLVKAAAILREAGSGLLIFDGYRPWHVTQLFWDESSESARKFLANPERGSIHNRGCAIDCGLFDLKSGAALPMPSDFDDFSERAYRDYEGGRPEERRNRDLLISVMEKSGFTGIRHEWWHYNHPSAADYPLFDIGFEALSVKR